MGYENKAGLGVNNFYGVRGTGGGIGVESTSGSEQTLRIDLTGQSIADAIAGYTPPVVIPKGAKFTSAVVRVDEAFVLGGTTPTVQVGAAGSVATNGFVLSKTELETVGTKAVTSTGAGTWAIGSTTGTSAAAKVAFALGGTSPTVASTAGKATLILKFVNVAKA